MLLHHLTLFGRHRCRSDLAFGLIGLCISGLTITGFAQSPVRNETYPTRPIRMIIAFPPGGSNDIVARLVGARLINKLSQQIIFDYRGGASGIIGTEIAARAAPDGYTILFTSVSHTMNEVVRKVPYDTLKAFSAVAMLGQGHDVLVANPSFSARTVQELITMARANPGKINYASAGTAGMQHFAGELFKKHAGVDLAHVSYKGGGPASVAVVAGEVPLMFSTLTLAMPNIRAGRLRALGIGSLVRSPLIPTVPTLTEAGAPGYEFTVWWGIVAPSLTTKSIVSRLNTDINQVLLEPEVSKQMAAEGADVTAWTPQQFGQLLTENFNKWKRVAKEAQIKSE